LGIATKQYIFLKFLHFGIATVGYYASVYCMPIAGHVKFEAFPK
jgi:hypothetical protein